MRKRNITFAITLVIGIIASLFSCAQEHFLFYPDTYSADYKYNFKNNFQELFFKVDDKTMLNGVLFHADSSKGLIFYLHGNAGSIASWGSIADVYLKNNYDLFILDYRGYGKSEGKISSEKQLYNDIQIVYDSIKKSYEEKNIIIVGYSIGTGPATHLASTNNPRKLILQAPYYNMSDLARQYVKSIPAFMVSYKFATNECIQKVKCPIIIFHGNKDEVIYVGSSYKLKELFKKGDNLIILDGQQHNGINENGVFQKELKEILKH
jgi:alpha-beta hydrolase superfamily lysophospholipase